MLRVLEIDGFDQFWAACDEQLVVHVIEDSILMMKYHSGYDCTACFHRFEDFMSSCPWEKFKLPSGSGVRFLWHLKRCSRDATTVSALQRVALGFANMLEFFKIDLEAFGRTQKERWASTKRTQRVQPLRSRVPTTVVWTSFDFGSVPSDWCAYHVLYDPYELVYARDFWKLIEDPPRPELPGSWPESTCDLEDCYELEGDYYHPRLSYS